MQALSWPAHANRSENPYTHEISAELERLGVSVVEYDSLRGHAGRLLVSPRSRPDIFHVHWPPWVVLDRGAARALVTVVVFLLAIRVARLFGTRVVWTVHNLTPHEDRGSWIDRFFWWAFTRGVDGLICLTRGGVQAIHERYPTLRDRPYAVIPHGHYRGVYPSGIAKPQARAQLGIDPDARVACFLGQIRPYKNVPKLIQATSVPAW